MRVLLDTHAFLWALTAPERLSTRARKSIEDEDNEVHVSAATVWEIAIKASLGRLEPGLAELELSLPKELERHAFRPLPVHVRHALRVAALPPLHRDPFDRLLVAQAMTEDLRVVTSDPLFRKYAVKVVW